MNSKLPSTPQGAGVKRAWTMKDTSVAGHIWELVMLIAPGGMIPTAEPILMREPELDYEAIMAELESVCDSMEHDIFSLPRTVTFKDADHEAECVARLNALLAQAGRIARAGAEGLADDIRFYENWLTCIAPCANIFPGVDEAVRAGQDACRVNLNDAPLHGDLAELSACPNIMSLALGGHYNDDEIGWPVSFDFSQLTKLRALYLDNNDFPAIPESVLECRNLECLSLRENQIVFLPEKIGRLTSLRWLDLRRTPVEPDQIDYARVVLKDCEILVTDRAYG